MANSDGDLIILSSYKKLVLDNKTTSEISSELNMNYRTVYYMIQRNSLRKK